MNICIISLSSKVSWSAIFAVDYPPAKSAKIVLPKNLVPYNIFFALLHSLRELRLLCGIHAYVRTYVHVCALLLHSQVGGPSCVLPAHMPLSSLSAGAQPQISNYQNVVSGVCVYMHIV